MLVRLYQGFRPFYTILIGLIFKIVQGVKMNLAVGFAIGAFRMDDIFRFRIPYWLKSDPSMANSLYSSLYSFRLVRFILSWSKIYLNMSGLSLALACTKAEAVILQPESDMFLNSSFWMRSDCILMINIINLETSITRCLLKAVGLVVNSEILDTASLIIESSRAKIFTGRD